ncbi:MAG: hypothetical protein ACOYJH_03545 [Anaerovoracaceae bacterium]|jgi:hypothetical protein
MIKLKNNASKTRKELFAKLITIPDQYENFIIMVLSYTHGEDHEREVIDYINKQDAPETSDVAAFVLQRDYENWGKEELDIEGEK